jgi:hypothetical protein
MSISTVIGEFNGQKYELNLNDGTNISIPVRPNAEDQLQAFVPNFGATSELVEGGIEKGNVGFNCDIINSAPHLHGTHTECVGHISNPQHMFDPKLAQNLRHSFLSAALISVAPIKGITSGENYTPKWTEHDMAITRTSLEQAFNKEAPYLDKNMIDALVIRTRPNDPSKRTRNYTTKKTSSAFFTTEAMQYLAEHKNIKHLIVDTISVDRSEDDGKLSNHHTWWNIEQGTNTLNRFNINYDRTITELAYIPNSTTEGIHFIDGLYFANIQPGNFENSDAITSNVTLFSPRFI